MIALYSCESYSWFNSAYLIRQIEAKAGSSIVPGKSVGALRISDTYDRVIEIVGRKKEDEEYHYTDPCMYTEIHSLDLEKHANGLFIYLKEGRVFQIESATPRYATVEGITADSSVDFLRSKYSRLQSYVLLGSGGKLVGGRDLIYLVDKSKGIAFELYYNRKLGKRLVSKVSVFEPNTEYLPEGCIARPRSLRKISPQDIH